MITASLANDYNKDVVAIPGRKIDKFSAGCNYLIKNQQAHLVETGDDLINLIGVDQVLYGSDWPHPEGLAEPTHYITALEHLALEDQAKIMGGNLGRLITT